MDANWNCEYDPLVGQGNNNKSLYSGVHIIQYYSVTHHSLVYAFDGSNSPIFYVDFVLSSHTIFCKTKLLYYSYSQQQKVVMLLLLDKSC